MKVAIIFAFLFCCGILSNKYRFGYGLKDAFWRVVWIWDEGTIWAPGFSEEKFNKIELGMTDKEVLEIMGEPLNPSNSCANGCYWSYTNQKEPSADFDQRWVYFEKGNKVIEVRKSFYVD